MRLAVLADNSNDKSYPPGKTQYTLDFAYHGGIYRDVWMICKNKLAITDAIGAKKVAGGGVFVHFDNIRSENADVYVDTELHNNHSTTRTVVLETTITDKSGVLIKKIVSKSSVKAGESKTQSAARRLNPLERVIRRLSMRIL